MSPRGRALAGERYDVEVGAVAHGGHCVARLDDAVPDVGGTVVFVRHTVPGERVMRQDEQARSVRGFAGYPPASKEELD